MKAKDDIIPVTEIEMVIDCKTGEIKQKVHESFLYKDEDKNCEYFISMTLSGCINYCKGNEPYSCHRSKKEGLCHTKKLNKNHSE